MAKIRNTKGQFVSGKLITVKMTNVLEDIAYKYETRIGALLRDELAKSLQHEIYASYTPTADGSYQHTRTLITGIYATIEDGYIQAKVSDNKTYDAVNKNGEIYEKPAIDIYNYLKFGTKAHAKSEVYPYLGDNNKILFAEYKPTPPHNFEARTKEYMNGLVDDIKNNPELYLKPYLNKYKNLRMKY